jgi:hypothetical protein
MRDRLAQTLARAIRSQLHAVPPAQHCWRALALTGVVSCGEPATPEPGAAVGFAEAEPAVCEAGDLRLDGEGAVSAELGTLPLHEPVDILGEEGLESPPVAICIPEDAVSLVLFGRGGIPTSWSASGAGEILDPGSRELLRWAAPVFSLPKSPEFPLISGRHVFRLGSVGHPNAEPLIGLRRGALEERSRFAVNFIVVGDTEIAWRELEHVVASLQSLLAPVGLRVDPIGIGSIAERSLSMIEGAQVGALSAASVDPDPSAPLAEHAANVYLVSQILVDDPAGSVLGLAMAMPGLPGVRGADGVVLSLDAHRFAGRLATDALSVTLAHEVAHWHGLRHTSERDGTLHDLVADTPECASSRDFDRDGWVELAECRGRGADNLMFWAYDLDSLPTRLTRGQGFVLRSAFTVGVSP